MQKISDNTNDKTTILVTGSPSEEYLKYVLKDYFEVLEDFSSSKKQYESSSFNIAIMVGLERAHFDLESFKVEFEENEQNFGAIICIENLNPRPETLVNNIKILEKCFSSSMLNNLLYFFFASNGKLDLDTLREKALNFNEVFNVLNIQHDSKKRRDFVNTRIHTLHDPPKKEIFIKRSSSSFFKNFYIKFYV